MPGHGAGYQGDKALAGDLKKAGCGMSVAEVRGIAAGVNATPEAPDPEAWTVLVAPSAGPELKSQLLALARALGEQRNDGLGISPAPPERLAALRGALRQAGFEGFLVPLTDEHQGEFLPPRAQRLAWLTGFSGSAGLAIVLEHRAAIFSDGRYTLQVQNEVDTTLFEPCHISEQPPIEWIAAALGPDQKLGYDPWLHTAASVSRFRGACEKAGAVLVPLDANPLDSVWTHQPPPPLSPVVPHDIQFAGKSAQDKRREVAAGLASNGLDAAVLTAPDSIAWLLNIRGGDVLHTPLPLAFAIVHAEEAKSGAVDLFLDRRKLGPGLADHLGNAVAVDEPDHLGPALDTLGAAGAKVRADPGTTPAAVLVRLQSAGATIVAGADPCALAKACKNEVEIDGARAAHLRDGAALTRFLAWLARESPGGGVSEIEAGDRLAQFRAGNAFLQGSSFATISGSGPNGAIVHYRVDEKSNRRLEPGTLFLVDSGAQYLDGTTDVTRTVAIGMPTAEMRDRFTRVLKGHIALATARFPIGTTGSQLDVLARAALWQVGLDYDHGTGHGVGSFLGVHEGPQRISKLGNTVSLRPGMIVSNEPGYYKAGAFGIRIENLVTVITATPIVGAERNMLAFETLTMAPLDVALVMPELMTTAEIQWLDWYHATVRAALAPLVDDETASWLEQATRPIPL